MRKLSVNAWLVGLGLCAAGLAGCGGDASPDARPAVVSIEPADGSTGVSPNAPIVITFSKAMNPGVTSAAVSVEGVSDAPVMTWNASGTVLTLEAGLVAAEGSDPSQVMANTYRVTVGANAADLAGNELPGKVSSTFSTFRRLHLSIAEEEAGLTGNWPGGFVGPCAGDEGAHNREMRAFFTYALDALPDGILSIDAAVFRSDIRFVEGNPTSDFGTLFFEAADFDALDAQAFDAAASRVLPPLADAHAPLEPGGTVQSDVTAAVQDAYDRRGEDGGQVQFRLRFEDAPSADGEGDRLCLTADDVAATDTMPALSGASLSVDYLLE